MIGIFENFNNNSSGDRGFRSFECTHLKGILNVKCNQRGGGEC